MRTKTKQRHFRVVLEYANGMTRAVSVKASRRDVAEDRALKRNPNAIGIKRST
jgi:hypothetical protein